MIYDRPTGYAWITKIERIRWEFQFKIKYADRLHAYGMQRGTFFEMGKERPTMVPRQLKEAWKRF